MTGAPASAPPGAETRRVRAMVFVRAIRIDAEIGIYGHEHGRAQPLVIDVDIEMDSGQAAAFEHIADTVNYETVVAHAKALAAEGHFKLVETFAQRLADACMSEPLARRVRVRVEKPDALAPTAQAAGFELVVEK